MQPAGVVIPQGDRSPGPSIPPRRLAGVWTCELVLDPLTLGVCHVFCFVLL